MKSLTNVLTYTSYLALSSLALGCSLFSSDNVLPHALNKPIKNELPATLKVVIQSGAKIHISQLLKKNANCDDMKEEIRVDIYNYESEEKYPVTAVCSKDSNRLTIQSEEVIRAGTHGVYIDYKYDKKTMIDFPLLLVTYDDPEFGSGEDALVDGAVAWAPGSNLKGTVNYTEGDTTDWYKIEAELGGLEITMVDNSADASMSANLLSYKKDTTTVSSRKILKHKVKQNMMIDEEMDYFIEVKAKPYSQSAPYALLRKDKKEVTLAQLKVIDLYPVSDKSSMVVFDLVEGIKKGTKVEVFGQLEKGNLTKIGQCKISTMAKKYASCQMDAIVKPGIVIFKASFKNEDAAAAP